MTKIRASGGYRDLRSFQISTVIYDATYWFCERFLDPHSRTCDQMLQAARSGRQNIAEGSRASATSSQTELRLVNVARASLEELLLDYEDFLRHRRLPQWSPEAPEAEAVRRAYTKDPSNQSDQSDRTDHVHQAVTRVADEQRWALYAPWLEHADPTIRANALICLIHQANYLLDHQIEALERGFIEEGGYSEQLAAERLAFRAKKARSDQSDPSDRTDHIPSCPACGKPTVLRTAKAGKSPGQQFWGCSDYPNCKGIVKI